MSARSIDGKAAAKELLVEVARRSEHCIGAGRRPGLAVVLVGEDPASKVYVRNKSARATEVGIAVFDHHLPATTTTERLVELVNELGTDPAVHGILVQLPLPAGVDTERVLATIDPAKDVDGFHPDNLGLLMIGRPRFVPCTPQGCLRLLLGLGLELAGKRALVVGRSTIVGKPMAHLLLQRDATVTIAHSRSADLRSEVERAEIVVAAVGRPGLIGGEWIRPGAVVIDVGINRRADGTLCGDVDFAGAFERAGAITPVPGGVGPMTIACLLANVTLGAERAAGLV